MDREVALEKALNIASLLNRGQRRIQGSSFNSPNCGLLAFLPIFSAASSKEGREDLANISLTGGIFREILIFGSVARGELVVEDLDMIVLDSGYCSPFFEPQGSKLKETGGWYAKLKGNLHLLLTGWFGLEELDDFSPDVTADVDLHLLPVSILWSAYARERIARLHTDPCFLENAFSTILRYNGHTGQFVPVTLEALRMAHQPDHATT